MSTSPITDEGLSIVIELCGFDHPTATLPRTVVEGMVNRILQQEKELQIFAHHCADGGMGPVCPEIPGLPCEPCTVSCYREWARREAGKF